MIPTSLRIHGAKISLSILCVSGSYFLASIFLQGNQFYIFDAIWRMTIIAWILLVFKYRETFSKKKIGILFVLFLIEYAAYVYFYPSLPQIRIFISVVAAPILEELLFRGWIMSKIEGSNKEKILYSSIFFSLYHLKNAFVLAPFTLGYQMLYALVFAGPLFGWARLRYNTIFASIVLHSGNNTIADVMTTKLFPLLVKRSKDFS